MKRIILLLLGITLLCGSITAQISGFTQRGKASQELVDAGISIAHPSLPIGSYVTIANSMTGKEIGAIVIGRIIASNSRIADLSPGAWQFLELTPDIDIVLTAYPLLQARPSASAAAPVITYTQGGTVSAAPQTVTAVDSRSDAFSRDAPANDAVSPKEIVAEDNRSVYQPFSLTVNTYVSPPEPSPVPVPPPAPAPAAEQSSGIFSPGNVSDSEFLEWLINTIMDARDAKKSTEAPPVATAPLAVAPQAKVSEIDESQVIPPVSQLGPRAEPVQPAASAPANPAPADLAPVNPAPAIMYQQTTGSRAPHVTSVQVIPALPDPLDGKTYRLQIGAYSSPEITILTAQMAAAAGFSIVIENVDNELFRVMAVDVPSALVYPAIQRLGQLGISQIWIK